LPKKMTVQRINDVSLWDFFVSTSPQGTVFSKSQWLNAAAGAQGGIPRYIGVFEDRKLVAGITFVELSRGTFRKITTPALTPYGGIIYRPVSGKRLSEQDSFNMSCAEKIIEYLGPRYRYSFLVHSPGLIDIRPFVWAGWTESVRYTYILDLSDPDSIWDIMERRVRTVLRKAESTLGMGGAIDIEDFGKLYERIYLDRHNRPPVSWNSVSTLLGEVMKSGLAEMRTVRNSSGEVISAMVLIADAGRVYSWISGSIPGSNSTGAFSLLFWDTIRRYSETCTSLDMVGANIHPIAFFKKGFGGTLTPYYVTERYSSTWSRTLYSMYGGIKKLRSKF